MVRFSPGVRLACPFFLNLQAAYDLEFAEQQFAAKLSWRFAPLTLPNFLSVNSF
jgi:hypothetical protein